MDREKESPPERLPFCLDDTVGEIVRASQECPGVYYIAARKQDGKFLADEYYVVEKSSPAISKEAMAYGRMPEEDSRVLLYSFAEERRGYKIIEYEIYRYQVRHGIYADGQTSLRDIAFYNTFGLLMNALGTEVELQNNPNKVIAMSKAAGLDFLNF